MTCCKDCGQPLSRDEIGLTRKLINRGLTQFYCYDCLGRMFRMDRQALMALADSFRAAGCTLFL